MPLSIYQLRLRDVLTLCVVSLLTLGVIMVQSASAAVSTDLSWSWGGQATRHLACVAGAVVVFFAVSRINPLHFLGSKSWLSSPAVWAVAIAAVACVAVFAPVIGISKNGSHRWVSLGITQMQPSELAKWAAVLFLAWRLSTVGDRANSFIKGFVPTAMMIGLLALLVVVQDFGTAALIASVSLLMMAVGGVRWRHLAVAVPPVALAGFWFVYHKEYRWKRMTSFLDPFADPQGEGYHMVQSLLSFTSGGLLGKGLGNGVQKLGHLPEDTTDFIFAVICEELGACGALLVVALYIGILFVGWQTIRALTRRGGDAEEQRINHFTQLLVFGGCAMVCTQAVINMAVATVSVPTKGLSLPLVSFGGSGLWITAAGLGLVCAAVRQTETGVFRMPVKRQPGKQGIEGVAESSPGVEMQPAATMATV